MDSNEVGKIRHEILSNLETEFTGEKIPARLSQKDEYGVEVLAMILDNAAVKGRDAIGEFFFLPGSEDEEVQLFVNLITLTEELDSENIGALSTCVAAINTYVLTGAFAIDFAAGSLVYKHTYEMPFDIDSERVKDGVDISMQASLRMVENFGHYLIDVNDGKLSVNDVLQEFYGKIVN